MIKFTVVVCAYNAVSRLYKTLESLSLLDYPVDLVEIVLVDNNSTDGTAAYAREVWSQLESAFTLRIVSEMAQGISHARKRGVYEADGQYIVFCDDDNWLDLQYLKIANTVLEENPTIGVLGGQGVPVTDAVQFPNWFYSYAGGYATGVQAIRSGDISSRGYVWGSGAIVRRDVLASIFSSGQCLMLSGRTGSNLGAGDDTEMCKCFLLAGYQLWYDEGLVFHHFIPKQRLTLEYLDKQRQGFVEANSVLDIYDLYLCRRTMRQRWRESVLDWLISEVKFYLHRSREKKSIVKTIKKIEQLAEIYK